MAEEEGGCAGEVKHLAHSSDATNWKKGRITVFRNLHENKKTVFSNALPSLSTPGVVNDHKTFSIWTSDVNAGKLCIRVKWAPNLVFFEVAFCQTFFEREEMKDDVLIYLKRIPASFRCLQCLPPVWSTLSYP
jgi:hypothetical protein